jgi:hypothetical protein
MLDSLPKIYIVFLDHGDISHYVRQAPLGVNSCTYMGEGWCPFKRVLMCLPNYGVFLLHLKLLRNFPGISQDYWVTLTHSLRWPRVNIAHYNTKFSTQKCGFTIFLFLSMWSMTLNWTYPRMYILNWACSGMCPPLLDFPIWICTGSPHFLCSKMALLCK